MILYQDENENFKLTDKAAMIKEFVNLKKYVTKEYGAKMVQIVFSYLHLMYDYDSHFLREIEDEDERSKAVRLAIPDGRSFKMSRTITSARDMYKTLYEKEAVSLYIVMRNNVDKMKDYASKITLVVPELTKEDLENGVKPQGILVDAKTFDFVQSQLPVQLERIQTFEKKLQAFTKDKIDVYGGGDLGEYER